MIHNVLQLDDIVSIIKKQSCKHGLSIVCSMLHHKIVLKDGVCKIESGCQYNNNIHNFHTKKGRGNHVHRKQLTNINFKNSLKSGSFQC